MTQELKEVMKQAYDTKREELVQLRDSFNYELEERKVSSLETQLNEAIAERNGKKLFYDRYEKMIEKHDDAHEYSIKIMGVENVPLVPLEPATPVEEENDEPII